MASGVQQEPVRGMRDLLGEEGKKYKFIVDTLSRCVVQYGYHFLETPILENTDIFLHGIGEETDIVGKEMFTFTDRSGNSLSLRPEGTAAAVRALVSNKLTQRLPQCWFYHGPMFRYDRPQKGRYRQFYQFGVERFGSSNPMEDAELIALCQDGLDRLGIKNCQLHLNSVGDTISRRNYRDALVAYLSRFESQLSSDSQRRLQKNPLRILDSKDETDQKICQNAPQILDYLSPEAHAFFEKVKQSLQALKIDFQIDPALVRGLDYYDHTVFEFEMPIPESKGAFAVCGGGRYNRMVEQFSGINIPAIGFAFGIDRLMLACSQDHSDEVKIAVLAVEEKNQDEALRIAQTLRKDCTNFKCVILCPTQEGLSKKMKYCDKVGVDIAIIIGDEEIEKQTANLKFFRTVGRFAEKTEQAVPFDTLVSFIRDGHRV